MTLRPITLSASIFAALAIGSAHAQEPLSGVTTPVQGAVSGITDELSASGAPGLDALSGSSTGRATSDGEEANASNRLIALSLGNPPEDTRAEEEAPLPGLESTEARDLPVSADVKLSVSDASSEKDGSDSSSSGDMEAKVSAASGDSSGSGRSSVSTDSGEEQSVETNVSAEGSAEQPEQNNGDEEDDSEFEQAAADAEDEAEEAGDEAEDEVEDI